MERCSTDKGQRCIVHISLGLPPAVPVLKALATQDKAGGTGARLAGAANHWLIGSIDLEHENEQGDVDNASVDVASHERRLEATSRSVKDDTNWDEHGGRVDVNARQRVHNGSAAEDEHRRDQDVGGKGKEHEHFVCLAAPACLDDLEHCIQQSLYQAQQHGGRAMGNGRLQAGAHWCEREGP